MTLARLVACSVGSKDGNSADKLRHQRSVAYSAELVLLNKHQISGGGACLHCYHKYFPPRPRPWYTRPMTDKISKAKDISPRPRPMTVF